MFTQKPVPCSDPWNYLTKQNEVHLANSRKRGGPFRCTYQRPVGEREALTFQESSYCDVRATGRTSMERLKSRKGVQTVVNHSDKGEERNYDRYGHIFHRTIEIYSLLIYTKILDVMSSTMLKYL